MEKKLKISPWEILAVVLLLLLLFMGRVEAQTKYELKADSELLKISHDISLDYVGTKEATGRNDGDTIAKILNSVGINKPAPYCQAYVYYCFDEARKYILRMCGRIVEIPIPRSAVAQSSFNYASKEGNRVDYEPKVNDLIVWKHSSNWTGHVGRIIKVEKNGTVYTVEANTSNGKSGDQREGNGIFIRKRNVKHILGRLKVRGLVGFKSEGNNELR